MIFLSKWVICRFQPLIFQGVINGTFYHQLEAPRSSCPILGSPDQVELVSKEAWGQEPGGDDFSRYWKNKPISSMYGIFTYIWLVYMVNVGKYTIHGSYGIYHDIDMSYIYNVSW